MRKYYFIYYQILLLYFLYHDVLYFYSQYNKFQYFQSQYNKLINQAENFAALFLGRIWSFSLVQKQPPEVFYKKSVPKKIAKFTGKHIFKTLFFNKVAGLGLGLQNY